MDHCSGQRTDMASRKIFHAKNPTASDDVFEFDEADVWNVNPSCHVSPLETKKTLPIWRQPKKVVIPRKTVSTDVGDRTPVVASASLPVNIPDWSKILKEDYTEHRKRESDEDGDTFDDEEDHDNRLPPHEYLARTRGASFSVHEGIGRTLKGRDLRQVRNAIWKKVGFED